MRQIQQKGFGLVGVLKTLLFALVFLASLIGAAWIFSRPPAPDAFYYAEYPVGAPPGTLIRAEPFNRMTPEGARAWRILYTTTRANGSKALASGLIAAPATPSQQPSAVIAWAHGTTGIAAGCAPSLFADPYLNVPSVPDLIRKGWTYVSTDYVGLGAGEGHAYLVGEEAARAVLDAVRAARSLDELTLAPSTVVWGHSQGGNSALWTGIIAPAYAADLNVVGVAALAPASDLPALVEASKLGTFGKIVSSYLAHAYARAYPESDVLSYLDQPTRPIIADIAGRCVGGRETLFSVAETMLLPKSGIFARPPQNGAFGERLRENTPDRPIGAALLIAQGEDDDLVLPKIQQDFVASRCAAGQPLEFRVYSGRDHVSLVGSDSPLTNDLIDWTSSRFSGEASVSTCDDIAAHD